MVIPKSYLLGSTLTKWDANRKHLIAVVSEILEKKKTSKARHLALIVVAFFCAYMTKKKGAGHVDHGFFLELVDNYQLKAVLKSPFGSKRSFQVIASSQIPSKSTSL